MDDKVPSDELVASNCNDEDSDVENNPRLPTLIDKVTYQHLLSLCQELAYTFQNDQSELTNILSFLNQKQRFSSTLWQPEDGLLLEQLKQEVIESMVLARPDYDRRFYLKTDWTRHGMGAVLCQVDPNCEKSLMAEHAEEAGGPCIFDKTLSGPRLVRILFTIHMLARPRRKMGHRQIAQAPALERIHLDNRLQQSAPILHQRGTLGPTDGTMEGGVAATCLHHCTLECKNALQV
jgi:hypothetical protein